MRATAALLLTTGVCVGFQSAPITQRAAAASPPPAPQMIDLYPAPGTPPAPGANGWFKDFGKQKTDPAMLKAAGIGSKSKAKATAKVPAKRPKKNNNEPETPGPDLAPVLGGFAVVAALLIASQAGN